MKVVETSTQGAQAEGTSDGEETCETEGCGGCASKRRQGQATGALFEFLSHVTCSDVFLTGTHSCPRAGLGRTWLCRLHRRRRKHVPGTSRTRTPTASMDGGAPWPCTGHVSQPTRAGLGTDFHAGRRRGQLLRYGTTLAKLAPHTLHFSEISAAQSPL